MHLMIDSLRACIYDVQGLHQCGEVFVAAKARKSTISWKRARDLAEGLELLRRIVSSALQAPLPLTWTWYAVVPMEYDSKASAPNATQPCMQSLISLLDRLRPDCIDEPCLLV
jgi:hypothetical protein